MPTLTVKNIPEDLYTQLKQVAALNRRSINSEIIICIEKAVRSRVIQPQKFLATARLLREKSAGNTLTDEAFNQAKGQGRP